MTIALEVVQTVPLTQTPEGVIRVTGTRLPLDTILHHYKQGAAAEEIVNRFPAVSLAQVHVHFGLLLEPSGRLGCLSARTR